MDLGVISVYVDTEALVSTRKQDFWEILTFMRLVVDDLMQDIENK